MIEIKLQFTSVAQAVAFLVAGNAGAVSGAQQPVITLTTLDTTAAAAEVVAPAKKAPGRPKAQAPTPEPSAQEQASASAPPAAEPSVAETPAPAPSPEPEPAASAPPAKPLAYAESDVPGRIMKLVEMSKVTGDKSKVDNLKALLGEFGVKSAKDLTVEQFADFRPRFDAIESAEAPATDEVLG